ncbi:MAG: hypothetical protein M5R36_14985 [Deltaproteobacteria bacterium]|nr:hypothetical protein [Deltaproteobacteria bacterium]
MNVRLPRGASFTAGLPAAAVFVVLGLLFFGRAVFGFSSLLPTDNLRIAYPWAGEEPGDVNALQNADLTDVLDDHMAWRSYAVSEIKQGRFPLWNPLVLGGVPFHAANQAGLLYPPNAVFLILPLGVATAVAALAHTLLGGFCFFLLLRALGRSAAASVFGGVFFAFNGFMIDSVFDLPMHHTLAWLPAAMLLGHSLIERGGAVRAAALSVVLGMIVLAGNLKIAAVVLLAWGVFFLMDLFDARRDVPSGVPVRRALASGAFSAALGIGLGAAQLLPTWDFFTRNAQDRPLSMMLLRRVQWADVAAAIFPGFGASASLSMATYPDFGVFTTMTYIGPAALLLGLAALAGRPNAKTVGIAAFGAVALLVATGTPLAYPFLVAPIIGAMGLTRGLLIIPVTAAGLLAAEGFDVLGNPADAGRRRAIKTVAAAGVTMFGAALVVLVARPFQEAGIAVYRPLGVGAAALLAATALAVFHGIKPGFTSAALALVVFAALDFARVGLPTIPRNPSGAVFPATPLTNVLRADTGLHRFARLDPEPPGRYSNILPPNTAMAYGLADAAGYDSAISPDLGKLWDRIERGAFVNLPWDVRVRELRSAADLNKPWFELLGVKYILSRVPIDQPHYTLVMKDGIFLYRNDRVFPRARFLPTRGSRRIVMKPVFSWTPLPLIRSDISFSNAPRRDRAGRAGRRGRVRRIGRDRSRRGEPRRSPRDVGGSRFLRFSRIATIRGGWRPWTECRLRCAKRRARFEPFRSTRVRRPFTWSIVPARFGRALPSVYRP